MSDQTDIERMAEKWAAKVYLPGLPFFINALTELSTIKDAETARLKEACSKEFADVEKLSNENQLLRARLADATAEIEKVNKFRERACAKHREVRDERDQYHSAALQFQGRQLALESQCQRMMDALRKVSELPTDQSASPNQCCAVVIANDALSAPLDLELLNRVRAHAEEIKLRLIAIGYTGGGLEAETNAILKSLSPSPNPAK